MTVIAAGNNNDPLAIVAPTGLEFQITDTKLYVPVVTLSTENGKKRLEQLKSGFKRTVEEITEGDHRDSFSHYYVQSVEIRDFNVLIDR